MLKKILLLGILFLPSIVFAKVNYTFENYYVDAYIRENGDLEVDELMVLNGDFHGYIRDLVYRNSNLTYKDPFDFESDALYNGLGIDNVFIRAKKIQLNEASFDLMHQSGFTPLSKVYYDADAKDKDYVESSIQDGKSYKMYYESKGEVVAFLMSYVVKDVVVLHQDIAEIYWTFLGPSFDDDIKSVNIRLYLPHADAMNSFRMFTHGDNNANIYYIKDTGYPVETVNETTEWSKVDKIGCLLTASSVNANTSLDIRATFSKDLVSSISLLKQTKLLAFSSILNVENKRSLVKQQETETSFKTYQTIYRISLIYVIVIILWWIFVYLHYDREYKVDFKEKYYKDFIDDYSVEVVDYLVHGHVTMNAFSASIMNLIYKKNIKMKELKKSHKGSKEYELTLLNRNGVTETENVLLDFLFQRMGNGKTVTTRSLKKYASSSEESFEKYYQNWENCVIKDAEKEKFMENHGVPKISAIFLILLAFFIVFAAFYFDALNIFTLHTFLLSIAFLIYVMFIKKRSRKGQEHYVKWMAFKNFLIDFKKFPKEELPLPEEWERYYVYASVFEIISVFQKNIKAKIKIYDSTLPILYFNNLVFLHNRINRSVSHQKNISTTNSSSYGGTSSFGGFAGGGGGGRGF